MKGLLIIAVLLACLPALAQERGAAKVEFRVTRFDPGDRKSPVFQVGPLDKQVEVEVPLTYIAGPFEATLRDGRFLDFREGSEEEPGISVEIAEGERKDLLLLFIAGKEEFRVLKVRTPVNRIAGGDRYIVNATTSDLAFKLGDSKPIRIEPGKSGLLKGPGGNDIVALPVLISQKKGDEWELASTENWYCDPRVRKYLFAYMSPRTGHLSFHPVSERL